MGPDIERLRLTAGGIQPSPTQTKCHDRSVSTVGQTPGDTIKCSSSYFFFYYIHVLHFFTMEHKLIKKWIVGFFYPFSITFNTWMYITWVKMFATHVPSYCLTSMYKGILYQNDIHVHTKSILFFIL